MMVLPLGWITRRWHSESPDALALSSSSSPQLARARTLTRPRTPTIARAALNLFLYEVRVDRMGHGSFPGMPSCACPPGEWPTSVVRSSSPPVGSTTLFLQSDRGADHWLMPSVTT